MLCLTGTFDELSPRKKQRCEELRKNGTHTQADSDKLDTSSSGAPVHNGGSVGSLPGIVFGRLLLVPHLQRRDDFGDVRRNTGTRASNRLHTLVTGDADMGVERHHSKH